MTTTSEDGMAGGLQAAFHLVEHDLGLPGEGQMPVRMRASLSIRVALLSIYHRSVMCSITYHD